MTKGTLEDSHPRHLITGNPVESKISGDSAYYTFRTRGIELAIFQAKGYELQGVR
jgi:hypothetical protein